MERATASDAELIDASRRGERAAFGALVERYARMVEAVSYAGTNDRALGEDIAQDTFVAAWCDLGRLRDTAAVRPWLCGIARNLALKARRRRGREVAAAEPDAIVDRTPFDALRDGEAERLVAAALERVPAAYREALVMFYYEQRSTKDVAEALGLSEEAVHQRLSRGRRHLAAGIEESVEHVLEGQRSRRNLAACVLGALPVALVAAPSHAEAAPKGSNMLKVGAIVIAATSVAVGTVVAWPRADAKSGALRAPSGDTARGHDAHPVKPAPSHGPAAALPVLPARADDPANANGNVPSGAVARDRPVDCAAVARHMLDMGMAAAPPPANVKPSDTSGTVRLLTSQFEQMCREAGWSSSTLACVMAADDMWNAMMCQGASTLPPTALAPPGVDISCAAVAAHAFAITADSIAASVPTAARAAIDAQRSQVVAMFQTTCTRETWTETQRRCAVAATSPFVLGACTQSTAPRRPTPVLPGADASCAAVGKHVAAVMSQQLSDAELPGIAANVRADLATNNDDMPSQIETACTNGRWSDPLRRCLLGIAQPNELAACQQP